MNFNDIVGHERPVKILKRAVAGNTLAHAYLFSGEEGVGKKAAALRLAAAVNCGTPGPDGGCGACPSCRKVAAAEHPDVRILAADGDEIRIDQIRQAQADLTLKPFEGVKKVLIVDGADDMNTASANAFLKTLEEPPGDTLIILVSARPHGLLPTIRSRCQEIRFNPLTRRTLAALLVRMRGLSEDDASYLAALARGSVGRALNMDPGGERSARKEALDLFESIGGMNDGERSAAADEISKDRERFERLIDLGLEWLRDVVVYQNTGDEGLLVSGSDAATLKRWAGRRTAQRAMSDMDLFTMSRALIERRVSAQLVAENLFFKLGRG